MEPFQLICSSCAAKLKVQRASAIGQRLGCPRCGQMILVQAPDGHEFANSVDESASGEVTESISGNFDDMDMDAILEKRPVIPKPNPATRSKVSPDLPQPKPTKSGTAVPTPKPRRSGTTAANSNPDSNSNPESVKSAAINSDSKSLPSVEPMVPGENWVNPATRKKQKTLILLAVGIASLMAVGIGGYAIVSGFANATDGDRSSQVAVRGPDEKDPIGLDPDPIVDTEGEKQADPVKPIESPLPLVEDVGDAEDVEEPPVAKFAAPKVDIETPEDEVPPPIASVSDQPPEIEGFGDAGSDTKSLPEPSDIDTPMPDGVAVETADENSILEILKQSGTSLSEVRDEAAVAGKSGHVGLPKYFFDKPELKPVDFQRQKQIELPGVSYKKLPLQSVLNELSAISGLVLDIDVPVLAATGAPLNPEITLTLKRQSVSDVVRAVADSQGLEAVETDRGFILTVSFDEDASDNVDVADLISENFTGNEMVQLVTQMVYPAGWLPVGADPQPEKGTVEFQQGSLVVNHQPLVVLEVKKLVAAIRELKSGAAPESPMLKPLPSIDAGPFAAKYKVKQTMRQPIGQFLQEVESSYDVSVFVDWGQLLSSGWTPDAMAAGWMLEPTVGKIIEETAHSLDAAVYMIDDQTVWLTSFDKADNLFEVKLYQTDSIAGGKFNARQIDRLLVDSLGGQIRRPGVAIRLIDGGKILAVRAPQPLQRQIRAVLSVLK